MRQRRSRPDASRELNRTRSEIPARELRRTRHAPLRSLFSDVLREKARRGPTVQDETLASQCTRNTCDINSWRWRSERSAPSQRFFARRSRRPADKVFLLFSIIGEKDSPSGVLSINRHIYLSVFMRLGIHVCAPYTCEVCGAKQRPARRGRKLASNSIRVFARAIVPTDATAPRSIATRSMNTRLREIEDALLRSRLSDSETRFFLFFLRSIDTSGSRLSRIPRETFVRKKKEKEVRRTR